jgi:hypothetical protein
MSRTSAPVVPCSCAEGWKPEGWAYCAECYDGQIERLRAAEQEAFQKYVDANESLIEAKKALEAVAAARMPGQARRIAIEAIVSDVGGSGK